MDEQSKISTSRNNENSQQQRAPTTRSRLKDVCRFILQRHAFVVALSMTMLFAERESESRAEGVPRAYIYIHLGALLAVGSVMSFGSQKSLFALVGAGFTTFFAITIQFIQDVKMDQWLQIRMLIHDLGVVGFYLILASRQTENLSKKFNLLWINPYGKYCIAIFFIYLSFQLSREPSEQGLFLDSLPYGFVINLTLATVFMVCGLLLLMGKDSETMYYLLIGGFTFYIIFGEASFWYWHGKKNIEYWNQFDMLGDSVAVLLTLLLLVL